MHVEMKGCGAGVWPPYNAVRDVKVECRPPKEAISIQETEIEDLLQALLNHTSARLVEMQRKVVLHNMDRANVTVIEAVLFCFWGFDGSTGHSEYKRRYESDQHVSSINNGNLFAITLIPLCLLSKNSDILWNNRTSQSARSCRPIKLRTIKESESLILSTKNI